MSIDPITLTVIQSGLQQVCDEMDLSFSRAAFSPVIAEANDRSDGIYSAVDGSLIAQGSQGLPVFVGTMQFSTRTLIEMIASGKVASPRPGDIYIVNDPYLGGTHLMDVRFAMPVYRDGEIFCWLSNTGHWPDTGGMVPGGFNSTATEIHQEGLRIPPVKLVRRGEMQQDIVQMVLSNIRVAEERIGDIRAQIAALNSGARRLAALLDRYGADVVEAAIAELETRSARLMRNHIETIPDGCYASTAYLDSDGVVNEPLEINLEVTVEGQHISFDFSKSSPPCQGPLNSVWASTLSAVYVGLKHIFPDVPMNAGCFEPITVEKPRGTFLYAEYPRPVAGCAAEVSQRVMEAVFLALSQAIPDRLFAAPAGTSGNLSLGGTDPETGDGYIMYYFSGGGYGGWWDGDGLNNGCSTIGISKSQPVEILEQRYPILFDSYRLRTGSGGAGRHRGGMGVSYRLRLLRGQGKASFLMEHGRYGPPGILGGEAGDPNRIRIGQGDRVIEPEHRSKGEDFVLRSGDWIEVNTPGGGGYGPAADRADEAVARDRLQGYLDPHDPHGAKP